MGKDEDDDDLNEAEDEEGRDDLVDNDEMDGSEQGFLQGYDETDEDKKEEESKESEEEEE